MRKRRPKGFDDKLLRIAEEVAGDYLAFLARGDEEENAKAFAARQNAGKAALAHIEALLKLADTGDDEAHRRVDEQLALVHQAREDLATDAGTPAD